MPVFDKISVNDGHFFLKENIFDFSDKLYIVKKIIGSIKKT